jgi:hypothetical protein
VLPVAERHRRDNLDEPIGQTETQREVAVLRINPPLGKAAYFLKRISLHYHHASADKVASKIVPRTIPP